MKFTWGLVHEKLERVSNFLKLVKELGITTPIKYNNKKHSMYNLNQMNGS